MPLTQQQRQANAQWWESMMNITNAGGSITWKDEGIVYKYNGTHMVASTRADWESIKNNTPKGWAKKYVKLVREKSPPKKDEEYEELKKKWDAMRTDGGADTEHICPKCNQSYRPRYSSKKAAEDANDYTGIEQYLSHICGDECWNACSEDEIVQYKYITPRGKKSAEKVCMVGGGGGVIEIEPNDDYVIINGMRIPKSMCQFI